MSSPSPEPDPKRQKQSEEQDAPAETHISINTPGPDPDPKKQSEEQDASAETHIFINYPSRHVERRPGNLVVKYGRAVKNSEREALAYAGSLDLPVPRIHDDLPNPDGTDPEQKKQSEEQDASAEIHILSGSPGVFDKNPGARVERHPGNLVVKYGYEINNSEREALAHAGSLNLPVPRIHDDLPYPYPGGKGVCIWMDYVEGDVLESVWPSMTAEQKVDIAKQLGDILRVMRRQKSTTGKVEACGGGELTDLRTHSAHSGGPFANEAAFQQWQIDSLYKPTPGPVRDAIARGLQQRCSHHQVVFTHGDLAQRNIIVKDNRIQALIDWEFAGWFPEHHEYVKFVLLGPKRQNRDWLDYVDYIFPEKYPDDLVAFIAMRHWQNPW